MYYIICAFWYIFSLLPFRVHYVISDILYFFIYRIAGYRKKVVRNNLSTSFPEKSDAELRHIEHGFYHWFCDYIEQA